MQASGSCNLDLPAAGQMDSRKALLSIFPMLSCLLIPEGEGLNVRLSFTFLNLPPVLSRYLSQQTSTWLTDTTQESAANYIRP